MIIAKCLQKIRGKNNQIIGYRLQDTKGNIQEFNSNFIKEQIKAGKIEVVNLKLTSDNRLIDITSEAKKLTSNEQGSDIQNKKQADKEAIQKYMQKARLLRKEIEEITTYCKHTCYILDQTPEKHIIYIPDDVVQLNGDAYHPFAERLKLIRGDIKIVGGSNLRNTDFMFNECYIQSLDLSSFETANVTSMKFMFYECRAQHINLSDFDTGNVIDMISMFNRCEVPSLDLSGLNTRKVKDMQYMFKDCNICKLNISGLDTRSVTNMRAMFCGCRAQYLDFSSFNTRNVKLMQYMFEGCKTQSLDISNFDVSSVENMDAMFKECTAKVKASDPKILEELKNR